MTIEQKKRFRRVYGIVLSVLLIASGLCLMAACIHIYRTDSYSREGVAAHFRYIAVPVFLCLCLIPWGFLPDLTAPAEPDRRSGKQERMLLKHLQARTDPSACGESLRQAILAQRRRRSLHRDITLALLAAGTVVFLSYALNSGHFQLSDINGSMIRAMCVLIPCLTVPFAYGVFAAYAGRKSVREEIRLLKQLPAVPAAAPGKRSYLPAVRCVFFGIGLGLLLCGFFSGGTADVLTKAINICTECVGLG